jgi:hypothetical protein
MVSAMQSREFGFGMALTKAQLDDVNSKRNGEDYFDKDAATDVHGTTKKKNLQESPFVRMFEYGANKDGYWTGNHMIVQLEDCIDCLKVIHGDNYDFVFLFDHSSGHAKKRGDGLDITKMNKGFGGKPQRKTLIQQHDGYRGPYNHNHPHLVKVGEYQTLNYESPLDAERGPFDMNDAAKEERREDKLIPLKDSEVKPKTKMELVSDILETEFGKITGKVLLEKKRVKGLEVIAQDLNIEKTKLVTHKLKPGWWKKGKGLLQVLWERGWIDESKIGEYQVSRAEGDDGNIIED